MSQIEESIEVQVPVRTAYNQWTQFEEFPEFMEGVEKVVQVDDTNLRWEAKIAGQRREWDATITEQVPDQRIAWRSTTGARNEGLVTFEPVGDGATRVNLRFSFEPEGAAESAGDAAGVITHRVRGDLKRFKEFIESRGTETGAWRGEVRQQQRIS